MSGLLNRFYDDGLNDSTIHIEFVCPIDSGSNVAANRCEARRKGLWRAQGRHPRFAIEAKDRRVQPDSHLG